MLFIGAAFLLPIVAHSLVITRVTVIPVFLVVVFMPANSLELPLRIIGVILEPNCGNARSVQNDLFLGIVVFDQQEVTCLCLIALLI